MNKTKKIYNNQKKSKIRKKAFRRTNKRSYKGGIKLGKYNYNITQKIRDKFGNIKDNFKRIKSNTTQKIRDKIGNIKDNFKSIKSNFTQKIRDKFGYIKEKLNNIKTAFTMSKSKKDQDEQYNNLEELIDKEYGFKFNYVVDYAELKDTYLQYKISDALRIESGDITLYAFYNINLNERLFLLRNNFIRFPKRMFKNQYYILKILVYVISFIPANAFAFVIILVLFLFLSALGATADGAGGEIIDNINAPIESGIINNYNKIKKPEFISKSYAFLEKIANKFSSKSNNNEIEENIIATQDKLHGWDNNYKSLDFLENKTLWKNVKGIFFIYNKKYEKFVTFYNYTDTPRNVFGFISFKNIDIGLRTIYRNEKDYYNGIFTKIIQGVNEIEETNEEINEEINKKKYYTSYNKKLDHVLGVNYELYADYLFGKLDKRKFDDFFNNKKTNDEVNQNIQLSKEETTIIDTEIINAAEKLENIVNNDDNNNDDNNNDDNNNDDNNRISGIINNEIVNDENVNDENVNNENVNDNNDNDDDNDNNNNNKNNNDNDGNL